MESIDKLRDYVCSAPMPSMTNMARAIVVGMTDEIEREAADLRDRIRRDDELFKATRECVDKRLDVDLWGVEYTPLPVDADGEAIRLGDVMDFDGDVERVRCMSLFDDDCLVQGKTYCWPANQCRHHHAPTVEDVLREFGERLCEISDEYVCEIIDADERGSYERKAIAEYASKLRLAEGVDA